MSEPTTLFQVGRTEGGKRLDQFLQERIPALSRTRIQRMIRERVTLSWGVAARPSTSVRPGGTVEIGFTPLDETLLSIEIPVLTRGEGWLAVDKPPGIPVHPVNRVRENTVIRMLRRQEGKEHLRLVHRLDAETSGALLVAESAGTARPLAMAFMHGNVEKEYLAWVTGEIAESAGRIDFAIGDDHESAIFVKLKAGEGKAARTEWRVERRGAGCTLLRLFPRTGRRHQLRVHLAAIGYPILGDLLYAWPDEAYLRRVRGEGDVRTEGSGPRRQLLHCARMVFPDPHGEGRVEVVAPTPPDFSEPTPSRS